jgi:hypothetical protein
MKPQAGERYIERIDRVVSHLNEQLEATLTLEDLPPLPACHRFISIGCIAGSPARHPRQRCGACGWPVPQKQRPSSRTGASFRRDIAMVSSGNRRIP